MNFGIDDLTDLTEDDRYDDVDLMDDNYLKNNNNEQQKQVRNNNGLSKTASFKFAARRRGSDVSRGGSSHSGGGGLSNYLGSSCHSKNSNVRIDSDDEDDDDWDLSSLHSVEIRQQSSHDNSPKMSHAKSKRAKGLFDKILLSVMGVAETEPISAAGSSSSCHQGNGNDDNSNSSSAASSFKEMFKFEGIGSTVSAAVNQKKTFLPDESSRTAPLTAMYTDESGEEDIGDSDSDDDDDYISSDDDLSSASGETVSDESEIEREEMARRAIQGPFLLGNEEVYVYEEEDNKMGFEDYICKRNIRIEEARLKKQKSGRQIILLSPRNNDDGEKKKKKVFVPPSTKTEKKERSGECMESIALGMSSTSSRMSLSSSSSRCSSSIHSTSSISSSRSRSSVSRRAQYELENNETMSSSPRSLSSSAAPTPKPKKQNRFASNLKTTSIRKSSLTAPPSNRRLNNAAGLTAPPSSNRRTNNAALTAPRSMSARSFFLEGNNKNKNNNAQKQAATSGAAVPTKKSPPVAYSRARAMFRSRPLPMAPVYEEEQP